MLFNKFHGVCRKSLSAYMILHYRLCQLWCALLWHLWYSVEKLPKEDLQYTFLFQMCHLLVCARSSGGAISCWPYILVVFQCCTGWEGTPACTEEILILELDVILKYCKQKRNCTSKVSDQVKLTWSCIAGTVLLPYVLFTVVLVTFEEPKIVIKSLVQ